MSEHTPHADSIVKRLSDNSIAVALVVVGIVVVAVFSFTDADRTLVSQIRGYFGAGRVAALRSGSETLSGDAVRAMLVERGLYDQRLNPTGEGIDNRLESDVSNGVVVVLDRATGLMWLQAGSPEAMTLAETGSYVDQMNDEMLAGFDDWRLPTVEEAMSLVEPQASAAFHIDPVFDRRASFTWTADRAAGGGAWLVYYYDGTLGIEQPAFNAWVRVVR